MKESFRATIKGKDANGKLKHVFTLGPEGDQITVCRRSWASAHNVSVHMLETLAQEHKNGYITLLIYILSIIIVIRAIVCNLGYLNESHSLNDTSHKCTELDAAIIALNNNGIEVTRIRLKALLLPNTNAALECYTWMEGLQAYKYFF